MSLVLMYKYYYQYSQLFRGKNTAQEYRYQSYIMRPEYRVDESLRAATDHEQQRRYRPGPADRDGGSLSYYIAASRLNFFFLR